MPGHGHVLKTPEEVELPDSSEEAKKKWFKTEKGKESLKKYASSEKGREAQDRYRDSPRGKLALSKYYFSDKGQEAHTRRKEKVDKFKGAAKWLKSHPGKTIEDYLKVSEVNT